MGWNLDLWCVRSKLGSGIRRRSLDLGNVRTPAVAGSFYPEDPAELGELVDHYLAQVPETASSPRPKAVIVPHAGYVYSGPVAAAAYQRLRDYRDDLRRVVLMGPSHRITLRGLATSSAERFLTPLGEIPLDREAVSLAENLPQVKLLDAAHAAEHSLEVHLPFLQRVLTDFSLVPFSVGDATPEEVAEVLELLWGGPETLIVISSDLSHYYDYETARRMDSATTRAIEELRPQGLDAESACGRVPVRGLLVVAKALRLRVCTVDLRNSGDTAGSRDQVVGYGSYVFS